MVRFVRLSVTIWCLKTSINLDTLPVKYELLLIYLKSYIHFNRSAQNVLNVRNVGQECLERCVLLLQFFTIYLSKGDL